MLKDFNITDFLINTRISMTDIDGVKPKSLNDILTELEDAGLFGISVPRGTDLRKAIEEYGGPILYLFTPEGAVVVPLTGHSPHLGNLPLKPDGYKDGSRLRLSPDRNQAPLVVAPAVHTPYHDSLPRKPDAYKD